MALNEDIVTLRLDDEEEKMGYIMCRASTGTVMDICALGNDKKRITQRLVLAAEMFFEKRGFKIIKVSSQDPDTQVILLKLGFENQGNSTFFKWL